MKLLVNILIITILTLLLYGCGREYNIKGIVITEQGKDKGQIIEITGQQIPKRGVPVAGAKVRMIHKLDEQGNPVEDTTWQIETVTNEQGLFEINDYAVPGEKNLVGLEISKSGYKTEYTTYWDYINMEQVFLVVLVTE